MLNSQLITSEYFNIKKSTTRQKHDSNIAHEIKLVWSNQSELVNDIDMVSTGVVCACTWISANDVSRSCPIDDRRVVFSRLRAEKERSGDA